MCERDHACEPSEASGRRWTELYNVEELKYWVGARRAADCTGWQCYFGSEIDECGDNREVTLARHKVEQAPGGMRRIHASGAIFGRGGRRDRHRRCGEKCTQEDESDSANAPVAKMYLGASGSMHVLGG